MNSSHPHNNYRYMNILNCCCIICCAPDPGDHALFYGTSPGKKGRGKKNPWKGEPLAKFYFHYFKTKINQFFYFSSSQTMTRRSLRLEPFNDLFQPPPWRTPCWIILRRYGRMALLFSKYESRLNLLQSAEKHIVWLCNNNGRHRVWLDEIREKKTKLEAEIREGVLWVDHRGWMVYIDCLLRSMHCNNKRMIKALT